MTVLAQLLFAKKSKIKPKYIMQSFGKASIRQGEYEYAEVKIHNARASGIQPTLDEYGFQYVRSSTNLADYLDKQQIIEVYYPEIKRLIIQETGCMAVHIFDHTIRSSEPTETTRGTAGHVHNDYTENSFETIWEQISHQHPEYEMPTRLVQLNAWRPLVDRVLVSPLTVADARTISPDDLIPCDIVYSDRCGEIYEMAYNSSHKWYYYPEMERDEVLLIKGYDSLNDGRAKYAPHTAFSHPNEEPDFLARVSIEVRTIALF